MKPLALLLVALFLASGVEARTFDGYVTRVTDGDTLWVRGKRGAPRAIRLRGIDAPELCQAFGSEAQQALASRVLHKRVAITLAGKDDYQRWLGTVRSDGDDVGEWLVVQGYAWAHRWRRNPGAYGPLEAQARRARRGLWAASAPLEPREFRKVHGKCF